MEYQVKALGKTCAGTGDPLAPGSVCHSVLVERNGDLVRLDFSHAGWSGPPEHAVAHWKTVVPLPPNPLAQKLDPDQLYQYFEQLQEEASPATESTQYVLALLLLQKRRLRLESSRSDGEDEWLELSGARGEGEYLIRNLKLPDAETQQLQYALRMHFASGGAA